MTLIEKISVSIIKNGSGIYYIPEFVVENFLTNFIILDRRYGFFKVFDGNYWDISFQNKNLKMNSISYPIHWKNGDLFYYELDMDTFKLCRAEYSTKSDGSQDCNFFVNICEPLIEIKNVVSIKSEDISSGFGISINSKNKNKVHISLYTE